MLAPAATKDARAKFRRIARRVARISAAALVAAGVALAALLVYLQSAAGRRFIAAKVSELVSRELVADLRIERLEAVSSQRVVATRALLVDQRGRPLLAVSGLEARFDLASLLEHALFGPDVRVTVPEVSARELEVGFYRDARGELELVHAFEPTTPSASPSKKPVRISLPRISVRSVSIKNDLSGLERATATIAGLNASLEVGPGLFALGLDSERLRVADVLRVPLEGALHARIRLPGTTAATLAGKLGTLPVSAKLEAHGDELSLVANAQPLDPDGVRKILPEWPLVVPVQANAELSGRWGKLQARAELVTSATRVVATGPVELDPPRAELALAARALDLRSFEPGAPESALDVDGELRVLSQPEPRVELTARSFAGSLAGTTLPKTRAHVVYAASAFNGTLASTDAALPVEAAFTLSPRAELDFHVRADTLPLPSLARYGVAAEGSANIDVAGRFAGGELDARADARVRALHVLDVRARAVEMHGSVQGKLARARELGLSLRARGSDLTLGSEKLEELTLESDGSVAAQRVRARAGAAEHPAWTASANVAFGAGVTVRDAHGEAHLGSVPARLEVGEVRFERQRVGVRAFTFALGDGEMSGFASVSTTEKHIEVVVADFDPSPLAGLLGLEHAGLAGRFDGTASFEEDARGRHGTLRASVENGALAGASPIFADVSATLSGPSLTGEGTLAVAGIGRGHWNGHATLAERPVTLAALTRTTGELELAVSDVDIAELARRFGPPAASGLTGDADGSVLLTRKDPTQPVEVAYELQLRALSLIEGVEQPKPLFRVDVSSRGSFDAAAGRVDVDVKDAAGIWLKTRAEVLRSGSRELELLLAGRIDEVLDAPLRAELVALPRSLDELAGAPRSLPRGAISGGLSVTGTLGRPRFKGKLALSRLVIAGVDARSQVAAEFDYSAADEEYAVSIQANGNGVRKLDLTGGGHCGWIDHGFGKDFSLTSRASADRVALAPLGEVLGVKLEGRLTGQASITASARDFEAAGEFGVNDLALDRREIGDGTGSFRVHDGLAHARLALGEGPQKLAVSSELGLEWRGGAPRMDPRRGGEVQAEVRNYELATLAPLLRTFVSEIRGPINGFASLAWSPEDQAGKRRTKLRANASVSGGTLRLTHGTGSIRNAELRALANGDGTLQLTFTGSARSKDPDIAAKAKVLWDGPRPRRVEAELSVQRFPVSYEGVLLGTATVEKKGRPIRLVLDLGDSEQRADVSVPALEFELPTKEDTRLIDLTPDDAIHLTEASAPPEVAAADQPGSLSVAVTLGDGVRVKQPDLLVPVRGKLVRAADGTLDGALILPEGGTVSAFGQVFRLKQSSVRFAKQPVELGVLAIQASARTVEGIIVDLDVSGTVKKPIVRFRSDPPRSESEIVALLLGIRPDDSSAVPGQQDVGGSAMALAMNQLLRNSPLAGFQFGETQSRTGDTISTVSFRAGHKVWVEGWSTRQNQGTPYEATRSSGVVDWRFAPGFSLRTQLGYPSGVEMRWSHRY